MPTKKESQKLLWLGAMIGRAALRDVVGARHVHAKPETEQRRHQPSNQGVERSRDPFLAREEVSFLVGHARRTYKRFRSRQMGYPELAVDQGVDRVSILDKITGRAKKAAGDITGDSSMRAAGRREERKGEEKEKLAEAQERVEEKAQDVADLERRT
jgi:uncharacterized protein YjbJ (UPF0337 family)